MGVMGDPILGIPVYLFINKRYKETQNLIAFGFFFFFFGESIKFKPLSPESKIQILSKYSIPGGIFNIHLPRGSTFWLLWIPDAKT